MTADEARALFSDAYEDELSDAIQKEFGDALAADPALAAEYAAFRALLRGAPTALGPTPPTPDLLRGVQGRIRRGSRGRFYADRFAERAGRGGMHPVALAMLMLLTLVSLWLAASWLRISADETPAPATTEPGSDHNRPIPVSPDGKE